MNEKVALVFDSGAWFVRSRDSHGNVRQLAGPCPTLEAAVVDAALANGGKLAIEIVVPDSGF